jgi:glucose/arabinose dehydrogenase
VTKEERYLGDLGERIRDVQQGPDGLVYVVTDNPQGRLLRVRPVGR